MSSALIPTGEVHPVAELFPMLPEDELAELAADIKANGLQQPIVLDEAGTLIDGRNRWAACRMASVEPRFVSLNGADPVAYILSANVNRRHLNKGQRAMAVAMAGALSQSSLRALEEMTGVSNSRLAYASTVRQHAPDLIGHVLSGAISLDDAYAEARHRKSQRDSDEARFARLQAENPDLAALVTEERLTLADAWRTHQEHLRQEIARREEVTRHFVKSFSDLHALLTEEEGANQVAALWQSSANTMASIEPLAHLWTADGIRDVARRLDRLADDVDQRGGRLA